MASQSVHLNPNEIPISHPSRSSQPLFVDVSTTPNEVEMPFIMSSLSNKNKRKGFKSAMASALPQKIIFVDQGSPDSQAASRAVASPDKAPLDVRLVPPSEKQENGGLPQNIFVTSVDVEAHSSLPPKKRRRNPSVTDDDHEIFESSDRGEHFCQSVVWSEEDWLSGIKVEEASQVQVGQHLAWKVSCFSTFNSLSPTSDILFLAGAGAPPYDVHARNASDRRPSFVMRGGCINAACSGCRSHEWSWVVRH